MSEDLRDVVKEFFRYLDATEESDGGTVFHPVQISCCRALYTAPLNELLIKMKELSE